MGRLPFLLAIGLLSGGLTLASTAGAGPFKSIDGSKVNLRAGPGTDHERLFVVSRGYPVKVLDRKNGWAKVEDYEGDVAWVAERLLSDRRTLLVVRDMVNIRQGPSTERAVAFKAERNVLLQFLGQKGDWIHVRHADGDEGWVYAPLVWGN